MQMYETVLNMVLGGVIIHDNNNVNNIILYEMYHFCQYILK